MLRVSKSYGPFHVILSIAGDRGSLSELGVSPTASLSEAAMDGLSDPSEESSSPTGSPGEDIVAPPRLRDGESWLMRSADRIERDGFEGGRARGWSDRGTGRVARSTRRLCVKRGASRSPDGIPEVLDWGVGE